MGLKILTADWIVPVASPPVAHGAVVVKDGRIVDFGERRHVLKHFSGERHDYGSSVIAPAWVNAHCHLELSEIDLKKEPTDTFVDWIRKLVRLKTVDFDRHTFDAAIDRILHCLERTGTILLGDVTNGLLLNNVSPGSRLQRTVFYELLGFRSASAQEIIDEALMKKQQSGNTVHISPHAPYSVSPELLRAISTLDDRLSVHVAESPEEVEFLQTGHGPFRAFLEERNAWDAAWQPPAKSPVAYLNDLGVLSSWSILVHAVQTSGEDLDIIRERDSYVCLCPRSNAHLNVGKAPVAAMMDRGISLCVGTDSLASNPDLDVSNELYFLADDHGITDWPALMAMGTLNGARALGYGDVFGSIEPGKQARFNVFSGDIRDPEAFIIRKLWSEKQIV